MISIYKASVLDLLPPNLKIDADIIAAAKAVDEDFLLAANESNECILLPNISVLSSDILDNLAWQMHIDFYDQSLPVEIKRNLVSNSLKWHKKKGTKGAMEELFSIVFDEITIQEWFEYNGAPFTFRIITEGRILNQKIFDSLFKAIYSAKNIRSWLDKFIINRENMLNNYVSMFLHLGKTQKVTADYTIKPDQLNNYLGSFIQSCKEQKINADYDIKNSQLSVYTGCFIQICKTITINQEV